MTHEKCILTLLIVMAEDVMLKTHNNQEIIGLLTNIISIW